MDLHKANIEEIKWSLIAPNISFDNHFRNLQDLFKFRMENHNITAMLWITKQPIMDCANNLFNPKALIMIILN